MNNKANYMKKETLPAAGAEFEFTPQMAKEYKKCMSDILYFAENYFFITNLDSGKIKIDLYPAQKRVLKSTSKSRFMVLLSSRQAGKTTIMTIYALWKTCFEEDKRALIVANKEDTAINILSRIRMAYEQLPNWLKPGIKQWGKTEVVFANDSSITISSTSSTAARGDSINFLIIDEMAFIPEHLIDEFWKSVVPVISSSRSTTIFAVSTPNGTSNKFHEIYCAAESGEKPDWHHERIDWWEIPGRGKKWEKEMKQVLGEEEFDQEFGNAFIEKGESAISSGVISGFRESCIPAKYELNDGHYKIWEEPIPGNIYVAGIDVAEGVGEAASVIQILDITDLQNIRQVGCFHDESIDPYHFAHEINNIAHQWGKPPLLIERNNCGGQIIDVLQNTYQYHPIVKYVPGSLSGANRVGILSHVNSKYKGVTNMRYWLNSLQCVEIRDISLLQEFETFIRHGNNTWKKKAGKYTRDDRVMALCWALFILQEEITPMYFDVIEWDDKGKPKIIEHIHVPEPEYYRLDKYYMKSNAPLPVHFDGEKDEEDEQLLKNEWLFAI